MLNQLPWFPKLYYFLNEQQYVTEFSAQFQKPWSFTPLNQEKQTLLAGACSVSYMQFCDSKTHRKNAFAVSADTEHNIPKENISLATATASDMSPQI